MMKWLLRIVLGFLAVLALLLAIILVRSLAPAPIHDQELQVKRAVIPRDANAFYVLQDATNQLWWPEKLERKISDLAINTNWDDALAGTILASNRAVLAAWDAAAKLPDLQVPEASTAEDNMLPYLMSWKKMAQLAGVRENFLLHHGQDKEAFDQMASQIQLGCQMQNGHGVLIVYLVGTAVKAMGLLEMQRTVGKSHLTPNELKNYIQQIEPKPGEISDTFANAIKVEYQMQVNMLRALRDGKIKGEGLPRHWPGWPLFDMDKTKALFASGALKLVKAAPHYYSETAAARTETRPGMVSLFLSGNPVGQILYYMTMSALSDTLAIKSRDVVQVQATRVILALRAYQLIHGHLPASLDALVPEFLPAVPVDDFDGQPLRYSLERKIVYSVGKNLKDDGGDDRDTGPYAQRHLDLAYPIDF